MKESMHVEHVDQGVIALFKAHWKRMEEPLLGSTILRFMDKMADDDLLLADGQALKSVPVLH